MKRLLLMLAVTLTAAAQGKPYTQMYVFGDSYSDSGAGYVDGNGPTAVVYLAQRLGIPFTDFGDPKTKAERPVLEGLNFAVSGAQSGSGEGHTYPHGELLGRGMRNQVDEFAAMVKAGTITFDRTSTVFFLMGGLNDASLPAGQTRANEEALIGTLYALGARRFKVALLPEQIPQFQKAGTRANAELMELPQEMVAKYPGIQISHTHWGHFYDAVLTHPAKYGLSNVTDLCAGRALRNEGTTPCATPATYFFYHSGHPSTATHKAVGELMYEEAVAGR